MAEWTVDHLVVAVGPDSDPAASPVLGAAIADGLMRRGSMGISIDVDPVTGKVLDARGKSPLPIYAMGALRKGALWETLAMPEIRSQAADVARQLLEQHCASRNTGGAAFVNPDSGEGSPLFVSTFGAGRPILCLHGIESHGIRFVGLAARVDDLHVVAPDLRGHGRSPKNGPWTLDQRIADVLPILRGLGRRRSFWANRTAA